MNFFPDQLFILNHGELVIGVEDQLLDTKFFGIKIEWYGQIIDYLKKGYFDDNMPKEEHKPIGD